MNRFTDMGVLAFRQMNSRGTFKPHLAVKFRTDGGNLCTFSIDSTRVPKKQPQPDAYLVTHAHSDHNGKSAMLSDLSVSTEKTAKALEIRHEREFKGRTLACGDSIDINGVTVKTYQTGHTVGAVGFYWVNDVGTRILVTGDVKDPSALPKCDVLITEANYGDHSDPSCHFEDDIEGFRNVMECGSPVAFGAYAFGKAQRAVELLRGIGYHGTIAMEEKSLLLTRSLVDNAGDIVAIGECDEDEVCIVPPWDLKKLPHSMKKYVLTGRLDYSYPALQVSDHLDANGLAKMVEDIDPELTIVYHPSGERPEKFASYLNSVGRDAVSLDQVSNVLSNEFL